MRETAELVAGRQTDRMVHVRVFGMPCTLVEEPVTIFTIDRRWLDPGDSYWQDERGIWEVPHYSTDIAAAWEVVEKLLTMTGQEDIHIEHLAGTGWKVGSCHEVGQWTDWVEADTAPEAICRAALKALDRA